jgi:hypothetical protein
MTTDSGKMFPIEEWITPALYRLIERAPELRSDEISILGSQCISLSIDSREIIRALTRAPYGQRVQLSRSSPAVIYCHKATNGRITRTTTNTTVRCKGLSII